MKDEVLAISIIAEEGPLHDHTTWVSWDLTFPSVLYIM